MIDWHIYNYKIDIDIFNHGEKMAKLNNSNEPIEKQLWKAADKLRENIDDLDKRECR